KGQSSDGNFLYPNDWDGHQADFPSGVNGWPIWNDSLVQASDPAHRAFYRNADIYLDQLVPGILPDSWMVLEFPSDAPVIYRVGTVSESALAGFGLSGRFTGVKLTTIDGTSEISTANKPPTYLVRTTAVYARSEALDLIDLPIVDDIPADTTQVMLDG